MNELPIFDPWAPVTEPRFIMSQDTGAAHLRVPEPRIFPLLWERVSTPAFQVVVRGEYASPALQWRGWIFRAADEERLLVSLRMAEEAILLLAFLAWLGETGARIWPSSERSRIYQPQTVLEALVARGLLAVP